MLGYNSGQLYVAPNRLTKLAVPGLIKPKGKKKKSSRSLRYVFSYLKNFKHVGKIARR